MAQRAVFFFLNGQPIRWELEADTALYLGLAKKKLKLDDQNVCGPACNKYGARQSSIIRYVRNVLKIKAEVEV